MLKGSFNKYGCNFDDASKVGYSGISVHIIILTHDVNRKFLSRDTKYIVYVVMWPKFGKSSICMRKVIITSVL